ATGDPDCRQYPYQPGETSCRIVCAASNERQASDSRESGVHTDAILAFGLRLIQALVGAAHQIRRGVAALDDGRADADRELRSLEDALLPHASFRHSLPNAL